MAQTARKAEDDLRERSRVEGPPLGCMMYRFLFPAFAVLLVVGACADGAEESFSTAEATTLATVTTAAPRTTTTVPRPTAADPGRLCEITAELDQLGIEDRETVAESRNLMDEALSLSRFHWFRVTPRVSASAVHDPASAGATLGVRYVLEGSVRRWGSRIRVSAHLVDLEVSTTIWADRFDRELEDLFDLQDEMVQSIVGAVVPEFVASFQPGRSRTSISSWELAMRGWNMITRLQGSGEAVLGAREMFQEALADDENRFY